LTFDPSSGRPIANDNKCCEEWDNQRVKDTIDYYHLDEGTWNRRRKAVFVNTKRVIDKLEKYDEGSVEYDEAIEEAAIMQHSMTEFSSVAKLAFTIKGII
jgi:hypothetical protein